MAKVKTVFKNFKKILSLGFSLAKTQFKLRNEGSYLGVFWYLLDPLAMFFIIILLGGVITRTDIENYPIYLLLGLIMFNFFRQATTNAVGSIVSNAGYIKAMKISSESFVVSTALMSLFSHFFEIVILLGFIIFFKIPISGLLLYPVIFFLFFLFSIGFSFLLATLGAYVNDLTNVWSVFINLLWFLTPIFYFIPPGDLTMINKLNPIFYFITSAREAVVYNRVPSPELFLILFLLGLGTLAGGLFIFNKFKRRFSEVI